MCWLCGQSLFCEATNFAGVCFACKAQILSSLRWRGCARCGKEKCMGICGALQSFDGVFSLFRYDSSMSQLLVQAKDNNNLRAQKLLENLFGGEIRQALRSLQREFSLTMVCLPPLRRERLVTGAWHTALWFAELAYEVFGDGPVFDVVVSGRERQARLTPKERSHRGCFEILHGEKYRAPQSILVCDDVLTTGKTLSALQAQYQHRWPQARWYCLTLFRAPQG